MKTIYNMIKFIIKTIWNAINIIRKLFLNLIVLSLIFLIFYGIGQTKVPPKIIKGALVLNLDGRIVEQATQNSALNEALSLKETPAIILFDLVDSIRSATHDTNITGIVLQLNSMPRTSLTSLRYIGSALDEFKKSGKKIYAIGDSYSQSQYYLASFANDIMMSTQGSVLLEGLGSYHLYYKSLLDTLKVSTHIFRVGTYKSYVEPFIRDNMSDEAKENSQMLVDELWHGYLVDIAKNRGLKPEDLTWSSTDFITKLQAVDGDLAKLNKEQKLVDHLMSRAQMRAKLATIFGKDQDSYKGIGYHQYNAIVAQRSEIAKIKQDAMSKIDENKIAVVTVDGTIVDGKSQAGMAGGDTIAWLLRQAKNDPNVKAVILRVNSPGGSAFASEVIRQEIDDLQANKKPVVVSMGSVAASGGYWISSSADSIIAQPTTITGSIGIFGVFATFEKTLASLGVFSDGTATSDFAGLDLTRPLPKSVEQFMQLTVDSGYRQFTQLVSTHRHIALKDMDNIAQGRVWTGTEALAHGLVDALGNFDQAQQVAAKLAGLKKNEYELQWQSVNLSLNDSIKQLISGGSNQLSITTLVQNFVTNKLLGSIAQQPTSLQTVASEWALFGKSEDPKGRYVYCLNCVVE